MAEVSQILMDAVIKKANRIEKMVGRKQITVVAIEEMAELTQCLTKILRGESDDYEHLKEEFADVTLCVAHLMSMYDIDLNDLFRRINYKLYRAIEREEGNAML